VLPRPRVRPPDPGNGATFSRVSPRNTHGQLPAPQALPSLDGEAAALPSIHPYSPPRSSAGGSLSACPHPPTGQQGQKSHRPSPELTPPLPSVSAPRPHGCSGLTSQPLKWATSLGRDAQPSSPWERDPAGAGQRRKNTGPANGWHRGGLGSSRSGLRFLRTAGRTGDVCAVGVTSGGGHIRWDTAQQLTEPWTTPTPSNNPISSPALSGLHHPSYTHTAPTCPQNRKASEKRQPGWSPGPPGEGSYESRMGTWGSDTHENCHLFPKSPKLSPRIHQGVCMGTRRLKH